MCEVTAAPSCAALPATACNVMQVTRLEVRIRNVVPNQEEMDDCTAQCRESAMAVLACIVVACRARLEALVLCLDWSCANAWAQDLLVRRITIISFGVFAFWPVR